MNEITRGKIKSFADEIIVAPNGTIQHIFRYAPTLIPVYQNFGVYGLNYYCILYRYLGKNYAIISGDRPFKSPNICRENCIEIDTAYNSALALKTQGKMKFETELTIAQKSIEYLITLYNIQNKKEIFFFNEGV
jgi:hypothetical protein